MVNCIFTYVHPLRSFDERSLTCNVTFADNKDYDDFNTGDSKKFADRVFAFLETKYGPLDTWIGHVPFDCPEITSNVELDHVDLYF